MISTCTAVYMFIIVVENVKISFLLLPSSFRPPRFSTQADARRCPGGRQGHHWWPCRPPGQHQCHQALWLICYYYTITKYVLFWVITNIAIRFFIYLLDYLNYLVRDRVTYILKGWKVQVFVDMEFYIKFLIFSCYFVSVHHHILLT